MYIMELKITMNRKVNRVIGLTLVTISFNNLIDNLIESQVKSESGVDSVR